VDRGQQAPPGDVLVRVFGHGASIASAPATRKRNRRCRCVAIVAARPGRARASGRLAVRAGEDPMDMADEPRILATQQPRQ
jgi:hypothetical protein